MTRKDYELIARVLAFTRTSAKSDLSPQADNMWRVACGDIADALASENPRFDRDRFLEACGVAG